MSNFNDNATAMAGSPINDENYTGIPDELLALGREAAAVQSGRPMTQQQLFVQIEGFTKEDFDTDDPYLFVLDHHNGDEILYTRLKNKLFDQMKLVKYSANTGKRQMQVMERKNSALLPGVANQAVANGFTGVEKFFGTDHVNYGQYTCSDNGISGATPLGIPFVVCRHPIIISKRSVNILSNIETVDISYVQDNQWKTIRQIPRADIASTQKIVAVLASRGVNITSESAKNMVTYLSDFDALNRNIIPRVRTTDTIGWMPDGSFVPFDGDIEVDAMSSDPSLASMSAALHKEGDPEVWLNAVRELRGSPDSVPIRMMLAASFASVLVEPLGRLPGWVHMVGKGTSGKTISLRLAASIWGKNEVSDGWMRNMNSTKVGLEVLAGFAHNLPLCLNELQTIQNEKDFQERVYAICECSGRTRGSRSGGLQRGYSWRLMALSCGEQQIVTDSAREGANSRVVEIMVDHMLYGDPAKGEPQKFCTEVLDKSYGHAGPMFISGLKSEDRNALSAEFVDTTSALIAAGKAPKQADTGALLLLADRLAEKWVFQDGVRLTADDVKAYLKGAEEINDYLKGFESIKSMIVEKNSNFVSEFNKAPHDAWGKITDGGNTVYVIKSIFDREIKERGYDAKRMVMWLAQTGVLICSGRPKHEFQQQVRVIAGANPVWCYQFNMSDDVDPTKDIPHGSTEVTADDPVQMEIPF